MKRIALAVLALVGMALMVVGCGNGRCTSGPDTCSAGTIKQDNVDCWYCCALAGQSCSPNTPQDQTGPQNPCCSGICQSNGKCACSAVGNPCEKDADCCHGSCLQGLCVLAACSKDTQCASGTECVLNGDVQGSPLDGGACFATTGGACRTDSECVSGSCQPDGGGCTCITTDADTYCNQGSDCCSGKCDAGLCF